MICYKDRSFCALSDQCANTKCYRKITEQDREGSRRTGLPFALINYMNENCGHIPIKEDNP